MKAPAPQTAGSRDLWYFEDFEVGHQGVTHGRRVTDADILHFAAVSGDYHPVHFDEAFAETQTAYGRRVAHGILGISITTGLLARDAPHLLGTGFAGLAFPGLEWRFVAPILPGATLYVRYRVADKRLTSNPSRGIVRHEVEVVDGEGATLQTGIITMMVAAAGAADGH